MDLNNLLSKYKQVGKYEDVPVELSGTTNSKIETKKFRMRFSVFQGGFGDIIKDYIEHLNNKPKKKFIFSPDKLLVLEWEQTEKKLREILNKAASIRWSDL